MNGVIITTEYLKKNFYVPLLIGIPIGITSSLLGSNIFEKTVGIKKYESIIKKMRKKHDKIVLLVKKLNTIEAKDLIDSYISDNKFVSVNNVIRKYDYLKEAI